MAFGPSSVGLGLLVEPPVVPWNTRCSTGAINAIVRVSFLVLFSIRNWSPVMAIVQGLKRLLWPDRLYLPGWELVWRNCILVLEYPYRIPALPRLGMGNLLTLGNLIHCD